MAIEILKNFINGKWAREFNYRIPSGNIGINIGIAAPLASFPFSGMKDSFFGNLHGQGIDFQIELNPEPSNLNRIRQAVLLEEKRHRYYETAAEKTPIREVARYFARIAEENEKSRGRLQERIKQLAV